MAVRRSANRLILKRETGSIELTIQYAEETDVSAAEFADVLRRSTLAARRPVADANRLQNMLQNAGVIITARTANRLLVGISRAITDYHYCTYLSDLCVDEQYQRQGVGRELIRRTHDAAGRHTNLILLAAPAARDYYPHIGLQPHDSCWMIPAQDCLESSD